MDKFNHEMPVLNEALSVARGSKIPGMGEGEAKMVRVVLQMEDATVEISEQNQVDMTNAWHRAFFNALWNSVAWRKLVRKRPF
jgi:hypothetical protein